MVSFTLSSASLSISMISEVERFFFLLLTLASSSSLLLTSLICEVLACALVWGHGGGLWGQSRLRCPCFLQVKHLLAFISSVLSCLCQFSWPLFNQELCPWHQDCWSLCSSRPFSTVPVFGASFVVLSLGFLSSYPEQIEWVNTSVGIFVLLGPIRSNFLVLVMKRPPFSFLYFTFVKLTSCHVIVMWSHSDSLY